MACVSLVLPIGLYSRPFRGFMDFQAGGLPTVISLGRPTSVVGRDVSFERVFLQFATHFGLGKSEGFLGRREMI